MLFLFFQRKSIRVCAFFRGDRALDLPWASVAAIWNNAVVSSGCLFNLLINLCLNGWKNSPLINIHKVLSACRSRLSYTHNVQIITATGRQLQPPNEAHKHLFPLQILLLHLRWLILIFFLKPRTSRYIRRRAISPALLWHFGVIAFMAKYFSFAMWNAICLEETALSLYQLFEPFPPVSQTIELFGRLFCSLGGWRARCSRSAGSLFAWRGSRSLFGKWLKCPDWLKEC